MSKKGEFKPCICENNKGCDMRCSMDCENRVNLALERLYKLTNIKQGGILGKGSGLHNAEGGEFVNPIPPKNLLPHINTLNLLLPIPKNLSIPPAKVLAYNGKDWMVGALDWMENDKGEVVGVCCVRGHNVEGVGVIDTMLKNITHYLIL